MSSSIRNGNKMVLCEGLQCTHYLTSPVLYQKIKDIYLHAAMDTLTTCCQICQDLQIRENDTFTGVSFEDLTDLFHVYPLSQVPLCYNKQCIISGEQIVWKIPWVPTRHTYLWGLFSI